MSFVVYGLPFVVVRCLFVVCCALSLCAFVVCCVLCVCLTVARCVRVCLSLDVKCCRVLFAVVVIRGLLFGLHCLTFVVAVCRC